MLASWRVKLMSPPPLRMSTLNFQGGEAYARRLADQLGCGTVSPLPGGNDPHRLVVIAGPPSATCT